MFDRPIKTSDAAPLAGEDHLFTVRALLSALQDFAVAGRWDAASQQDDFVSAPQSLAARYAAANSITRRRFDAILRETEAVTRMGFGVIAGRRDRSDPGTAAAARFLGKSMSATLQRLENLLAPQAI